MFRQDVQEITRRLRHIITPLAESAIGIYRGDPYRLAAILKSTQFIDAPTKPLVVALNAALLQ